MKEEKPSDSVNLKRVNLTQRLTKPWDSLANHIRPEQLGHVAFADIPASSNHTAEQRAADFLRAKGYVAIKIEESYRIQCRESAIIKHFLDCPEYQRGIPDFYVSRPDGRDAFLCEVKSEGDQIALPQMQWWNEHPKIPILVLYVHGCAIKSNRKGGSRPTRFLVFQQVVRGIGLSQVAKNLKISRQAAHRHVRELEEIRVIKRLAGCKNPLLFGPDVRADWYRKLNIDQRRQSATNQVGAVPPSLPVGRVHGGSYKFLVVDGPKTEPPWARSWLASGVQMFALRRDVWGRSFRIVEVRGNRRVLRVQPPQMYATSPHDIRTARQRAMKECTGVANAFAKEFGYRLQGALSEEQRLEFAFPAPRLAPVGEPGRDEVWVDRSEGEPEIETASPEVAASIMELPSFIRESREHQARLEGLVAGLDARLKFSEVMQERILGVTERVVGVIEKGQVVQANIVKAISPPGPEVV